MLSNDLQLNRRCSTGASLRTTEATDAAGEAGVALTSPVTWPAEAKALHVNAAAGGGGSVTVGLRKAGTTSDAVESVPITSDGVDVPVVRAKPSRPCVSVRPQSR